MHLSFLLPLSSLLLVALAQLPPTPPTCSISCMFPNSTGVYYDGCLIADSECLCKSQDYLAGESACIKQNCPASSYDQAIAYAQYTCNLFGVTVTSFPTAVPSSSGAASTAVATRATVTGTSIATNNGVTAPTSTPVSSSSSKKSTPMAAIVAGIVGGVLALGVIGACIWYCLRKPKSGDERMTFDGDEVKYTSMGDSSAALAATPYALGAMGGNQFTPSSSPGPESRYAPSTYTNNSYSQPMPNNTFVSNAYPNDPYPSAPYTPSSQPPPLPSTENAYPPPFPQPEKYASSNYAGPSTAPITQPNAAQGSSKLQNFTALAPPSTSSVNNLSRVTTSSTAYFDTASTVHGGDEHSEAGGSSSNPPSSSNPNQPETQLHLNQPYLTGEQLDFVASLQRSNVPHAEIVAVMERMRLQGTGGAADDAPPPMYDFKEKA